MDSAIQDEEITPLIDGGTEGELAWPQEAVAELTSLGFRGQARVIIPAISSCYECSVSAGFASSADNQIDTIAPPTAYPICTIANTPRLPEHCIEWASVLEWPKVFKGEQSTVALPEY